MIKTLARVAAAAAVSASAVTVGATAASADPSYDAGCASYSYHIEGSGPAKILLTQGTFAIEACWSGGSFSNNQITMERSNVITADGFFDSVDSVTGPVDSTSLPITDGAVVGSAGSADVYWWVNISSTAPWFPATFHDQVRVHVHLEPGNATWDNTV